MAGTCEGPKKRLKTILLCCNVIKLFLYCRYLYDGIAIYAQFSGPEDPVPDVFHRAVARRTVRFQHPYAQWRPDRESFDTRNIGR